LTVPAGGEVRVSEPAGLMVMLTGPVVVCWGLPESVTLTERFAVPAVVGVPLTRQPAAVRVRPAGIVPETMVQE
jgi:hypothetical protein